MTNGKTEKKDLKGTGKRNKKNGADGRKYDQRAGSFGRRDAAIMKEYYEIYNWLTPERISVELSLMNTPGHSGRRFEYPPSLIHYMMAIQADDGSSCRRAAAKAATALMAKGVKIPPYGTFHHLAGKYFSSGGSGWGIITKATEILESMGFEELCTP